MAIQSKTGADAAQLSGRVHVIGARDAAGRHAQNTVNIRLEYAIVVTFLYSQAYDCNESCKYYENAENPQYKFIPAVGRECIDNPVALLQKLHIY